MAFLLNYLHLISSLSYEKQKHFQIFHKESDLSYDFLMLMSMIKKALMKITY